MTKPTRKTKVAEMLATFEKKDEVEETPIQETAAFEDNWLKSLLDEQVERDQPLWLPIQKRFRASAAGTKCIRSLTFDAMGHTVPHDARLLRIFRVGHKVEEDIVETAKAAKVFVEGSDQLEGVHLTDEPSPALLLGGHIDLIVERPTDGAKFLVEVKSINTRGFGRLPREHGPTKAGESPLMKTHEHYLTQWNTYAWAPEIDLPTGCILFEDKNDGTQKYYWLERDKDLLDATLARHAEAASYVLTDEPKLAPVPKGLDPVEGGKDCKFCDHRYLCKRLPKGTVSYDKVRKEDAKLRG